MLFVSDTGWLADDYFSWYGQGIKQQLVGMGFVRN